jgi:hypothetical protein
LLLELVGPWRGHNGLEGPLLPRPKASRVSWTPSCYCRVSMAEGVVDGRLGGLERCVGGRFDLGRNTRAEPLPCQALTPYWSQRLPRKHMHLSLSNDQASLGVPLRCLTSCTGLGDEARSILRLF